MKQYPSRSVAKQKKPTAEGELRGRSRISRFDVAADDNRRSMRTTNQTKRTSRLTDDDNRNKQSEAYVSSAEEFDLDDESDDDVLYQLAEPKTIIKTTRPLSSRLRKETSISREKGRSRQMQRSLSGNTEGRKSARAATTKVIEMNEDSGTDCRDPKQKGCTSVSKSNRRSKSSQTENVEKRSTRVVRQREYTGRSAVDDRHRVGFRSSLSPSAKTGRQYDRSLSSDSFCDEDEESDYVIRQSDNRKQ